MKTTFICKNKCIDRAAFRVLCDRGLVQSVSENVRLVHQLSQSAPGSFEASMWTSRIIQVPAAIDMKRGPALGVGPHVLGLDVDRKS